jgi:hypothetical protein
VIAFSSFFDAFCTIRNASFLETLRCQTHPAAIDFIDMPLDFKSSMPVGKLVRVMISTAPMQKITRLSGVMVDVLVKKVRRGQTPASRNGCGLTASTQPVVKLPAWFARKAGGMGVHFFKTDLLKLVCSAGTN